jgi:hypothetical protein
MSDAQKLSSENSTPARRRGWLTYAVVLAALLMPLGVFAAKNLLGHQSPPYASRQSAPAKVVEIATPPAAPIAVAPAARPRVELVFALDTTGSMSGLIEGAKRKIWSLASFIAQGKPTPDLRVGLVGYRDIGDKYVTRRFDLDEDLDRVFARLSAFRAEDGGDTPEHVARALSEAVHKMSWTRDPAVVKLIYLVGDSPPHTDYKDGYNALTAARDANQAGIQVHAVRCGADRQTEKMWKQIAQLGHGDYTSVEQNGGMREEKTPYDEELARLHDRLSDTAMIYGAHREEARLAQANAASAPIAIKAARVAFTGTKGKSLAGKGDLVDDVLGGTKIDSIAAADLPAEIQALPPAAQATAIEKKIRSRKELSKQVEDLAQKRSAYLEEQERLAGAAGERDGFDLSAKRSLKKAVKENAMSGFKL